MDEVTLYRSRTSKSHALHQRGQRVMPLGVESNFRYFDPYPVFIDHASGAISDHGHSIGP